MSRELPSIASLRAFACAARAASFKRAAAELGVSPSALSRQIQALEEHLDLALFVRANPGVRLTDEGRRYLEGVDAALARLESAQDEFTARRALRVSALASFCESWLVPRLPDFERAHPGIALEIEATYRYADFARDAVDLAIRFGEGPWPGLHGEPLVDLDYFAVASPALVSGDAPLRTPSDLAQHVLIHVAQTPDAWSAWLQHAGVGELEITRSVTYDHVSIALAAAESGQGVALSTSILCARQLATGRLVAPFPISLRSRATYHFVCRPDGLADARIVALRDWLIEGLDAAVAQSASAVAK